jgi:hypothetical protein
MNDGTEEVLEGGSMDKYSSNLGLNYPEKWGHIA